MLKLILCLILVDVYLQKHINRKVYLNVLSWEPHSEYLGKFGIGIGEGIIKTTFKKY